MQRPKPYKRHSGKRQKAPEPPRRDWFDKIAASTAVIGIIIAVVSGALAQWNQVSNGKDTENALKSMSAIANSMAAQQDALLEQANATVDAANATAGSTAAIREQTAATRKSVVIAQKSFQASVAADAALVNESLTDFAVGRRYKIKVTIQNTGHVAIRDVYVTGRAGFLPKGQVFPVTDLRYNAAPLTHLLAINGRTGSLLTENDPLDVNSFSAISSGRYALVVIGGATFRDANGLHHRYSCTLYSGSDLPEGQGCTIGNDD